MPRTAPRQLLKNGLILLVFVVSLALLTPWGISHRRALEPRLAMIAIVFGTLSCAVFLVTGISSALSRRGARAGRGRAAAIPLCIAVSSFLLVATFMWAGRSSTAQTVTLVGAALFMITAAVLQMRARERSGSL